MNETQNNQQKYIIMKKPTNNLVALKVLLFCFFGGVGCIFPFLPHHMRKVGLNVFEAQVVSAVAPIVALLGPWIACPLADRMSGLRSNNGRGLRVMLAIIILLSGVFYALLMCIPTVTRFESDIKPAVSFLCGSDGAILNHERCVQPACHSWDPKEVGELYLKNCVYDCETEISEMGRFDMFEMDPPSTTTEEILEIDAEEGDGGSGNVELPIEGEEQGYDQDQPENEDSRKERDLDEMTTKGPEPPHLCYTGADGIVKCKVYTKYSKRLAINVSLYSDEELNPRGQNCIYDLIGGSGKNFTCRIPGDLPGRRENKTCIVRCDVDQSDEENSLLGDSPCQRIRGDPTITFWSYLVVRSIADIFPTAALGLLGALVIVATRETSIGRGDVGRQFAFGWLGLAVFGTIVGFISTVDLGPPLYWVQFTICAVLMLCAALVTLFATSLPFGPNDWWWHMRGSTGLGLHRYGWELVALTIVLILLGVFWSALDTFLPWHLKEMTSTDLAICLTLAAGALPAIPFMWFSEHIVNFCGHTNLLIIAFIFYIVRYTALYGLWNPWWLLLCSEGLEFLTLSLAWLAAVLYLRHLVPRHLTATGQGLAVAAHFCIGRFIGSLISGLLSSDDSGPGSLIFLYKIGAIAAAVVATLYFIAYHCCFKQRCFSPRGGRGSPSRPGVSSGPTTNGTYTPLRVYHNAGADGQKTQQRY